MQLALIRHAIAEDRARVELEKGAVARLEGRPRPGGMRLHALLPPRVLR